MRLQQHLLNLRSAVRFIYYNIELVSDSEQMLLISQIGSGHYSNMSLCRTEQTHYNLSKFSNLMYRIAFSFWLIVSTFLEHTSSISFFLEAHSVLLNLILTISIVSFFIFCHRKGLLLFLVLILIHVLLLYLAHRPLVMLSLIVLQ